MEEVHCDEGVAIHIGPEACAGTCEGAGEASVGGRIGQPLSRERILAPGADAVSLAEGNIGRRAIASALLSQALDCVRQAARLGKKMRFAALHHHLNFGPLRLAFYALRKRR